MSKTVPFQAIQLKQVYFKQFSLEYVNSLIVKTFLFQAFQLSQTIPIPAIQFWISKQFMKACSAFPKAPALLICNHQIV